MANQRRRPEELGPTMFRVRHGRRAERDARMPVYHISVVAEMVEQIPVHRMGEPEEIARAVCFLAQDASGYITGQIWDVDGGLNM